jgi:1,5-anhydro-D-fructose reductase (1,5-anhydro-D-mannitol-forming)
VLARSEFSFFAPPNHPRVWLHDRTVAGGGPIADIGVHCIDTLRFILRDEVVRVSTVGMKDGRSGEVESAAVMALEFSRGTLATVSVSFRAEYHTTMEVHGESSSLISENGLSVDFPVTVKLVHERAVVDQETVSNHLAYAKQVDEFADAVTGKTNFRVPGEEGWQNQIVLDAAYRSLETGRAETVAPVSDQATV